MTYRRETKANVFKIPEPTIAVVVVVCHVYRMRVDGIDVVWRSNQGVPILKSDQDKCLRYSSKNFDWFRLESH